jgi:hypothetical protein
MVALGLAWLGRAAEARWVSLPWLLLAALVAVALAPPLFAARRLVASRRASGRPTRALWLFGLLLLVWNTGLSAAILGLADRGALTSAGLPWVVERGRGHRADAPLASAGASSAAVSSPTSAVGDSLGSVKVYSRSTLTEGDGGPLHTSEVRKELRSGCARIGADGLEVLLTADASPCCALPPGTAPAVTFLSSRVGPGGVGGAFGHTVAAPTKLHLDSDGQGGSGGLGEYEPWATELTLEAVSFEAGRRVRGRLAVSLNRVERWGNGELTADGAFDVALCPRPDLDKVADGFKVKPARVGRVAGTLDGGGTTFEASTVLALRRKSRRDPVDRFELAFYDTATTCEEARAGRGPRPRFWIKPALPRDPSRAVGVTVAATLVRAPLFDTSFAWVALSRAEPRDGGVFAGVAAAWRGDDVKVDVSGSFEAPTCGDESPN